MVDKGIKIFTGNSHPELADKIGKIAAGGLGKCNVGKFSNGETSVTIGESARDYDVYIIQSTANPNPNGSKFLLV
jgi:ribose-phosphate pyrophosphokinase